MGTNLAPFTVDGESVEQKSKKWDHIEYTAATCLGSLVGSKSPVTAGLSVEVLLSSVDDVNDLLDIEDVKSDIVSDTISSLLSVS